MIQTNSRDTSSDPGFLKFMVALLVSLALAAVVATGYAADDEWPALQIVNVNELPLDTSPRFAAKSKTFFRSEKGTFIHAVWSPTWSAKMPPAGAGMGSHYHLWNEWAYMLEGDLVIQEPVSPYQSNGAMYRYIEGTWLDRPPYTLHGGGWVTGGLRAQNPVTLILFEEGDGSVNSVEPNGGGHFKPDFPEKPDPYEPDWQAVEQFARPWIVHSGSDLEWEQDTELAGRLIKWLSDDLSGGFRAQLVKIPPGWTAPEGSKKSYFEHADRMRYMLHGEMLVLQFDGPEAEGTAVKVSKDYYIHQSPRSIWGHGDGPVTEEGAVWLEVTYARGLEHGGGPIENAITIE
jgi:hypothetical protein